MLRLVVMCERYRAVFAAVHSVVRGAADCMDCNEREKRERQMLATVDICALRHSRPAPKATLSDVGVALKKRPRENAASLRRSMSHS